MRNFSKLNTLRELANTLKSLLKNVLLYNLMTVAQNVNSGKISKVNNEFNVRNVKN